MIVSNMVGNLLNVHRLSAECRECGMIRLARGCRALRGEAEAMKDRRTRLSHDLADARRRGDRSDRPDPAAAPIRHACGSTISRRGRGDQDHGRARRPADRRDRRLWSCARAAPRRGRRRRCSGAYRALAASRPTAVNLAPRARRRQRRRRAAAAGKTRRGGVGARRALCDEDVALNRRIGEAGLPLIEVAPSRARPHGQHPHPLQRRLARHRRLGHRDGADLHGA